MSNQTRCLACMNDQSGVHPCPSCGWDDTSNPDNPLYLPAGHLLNNRYTIGKVIGVGGFGIVYIAWDNNLDIRVAVKEFLPKEYAARSSNHISLTPYTGSANDDFSLGVEKFLDEAKALARFQDHPGIVTVNESFRTNNTAYMVMQYLDGMTMKEYLKRQPGEKIAFNVAVKAMTPIMDALREVHNAGFVHRDISPDNIFLTSQNQVKLLDFGSARYAIGEHSKSLTSVLKHGYAPVEQYSVKGKQGPWSEVYAVCATLYRCVTGFVPIDAMERIQGDTIKSPKQLGIDIPISGERAIMRGLALKDADRFENIQQLQQALATDGQADNWSVLNSAIQDAEASQQKGRGDVILPSRQQKNIIECPECGAKNKLNPGDDPYVLRCGKCNSVFGLNQVIEEHKIKSQNKPLSDVGIADTEKQNHITLKDNNTMDKTLRTVIIACICVITFSFFYYLVIYLPKEKELERAAVTKKEEAVQAEKSRKYNAYSECTREARKNYTDNWEGECQRLSRGSGCALPLALAESQNNALKHEEDKCYKLIFQSQ